MSNTLTVEAVSKNGKGFLANGTWYNAAKGTGLAFDKLGKGVTVEVDAEGKWVNTIKVLGAGSPAPTNSGQSTFAVNKDAIARAVAVKAVMEGTLFAQAHKDMDFSEAFAAAKSVILEIENYLLNGTFPSESV